MRILVALLLLAASVAVGLQALPVDFALGNYLNVLALLVLPLVVFYGLWRLADMIIRPPTTEFETDRRISRIMGSPWERYGH